MLRVCINSDNLAMIPVEVIEIFDDFAVDVAGAFARDAVDDKGAKGVEFVHYWFGGLGDDIA